MSHTTEAAIKAIGEEGLKQRLEAAGFEVKYFGMDSRFIAKKDRIDVGVEFTTDNSWTTVISVKAYHYGRAVYIRPVAWGFSTDKIFESVVSAHKRAVAKRKEHLEANLAAKKRQQEQADREAPSIALAAKLNAEIAASPTKGIRVIHQEGDKVGIELSRWASFTEDQARQVLALIASFNK